MNNAGLKLMATLAVALVEVGAASAEPEGISIGNEVVQPQLSFLQLDASSLSTAFDASGISSYKCKSALKCIRSRDLSNKINGLEKTSKLNEKNKAAARGVQRP